MRLINASTLTLVEFFEPKIPEYAILSHTWEDDEVSFQEMGVPSSRQSKQSFTKIKKACETTLSLGLEYIWVDTCCIDKTSSGELTESINSMFEWYRKSYICIVFLSDYGPDHNAPLGPCKWFSRGWTLQELIAPGCIIFYNSTWGSIDTKENLASRLSEATKMPADVITGLLPPDQFSVAQRMSWAAGRKTTRVEDRAYSLLGLFDISMPMIYGEGTKAFRRLQEEIIKRTNDLTILGWCPDESFDEDDNEEDNDDGSALPALAADPDAFRHSHDLQRSRIFEMPTSHTNMGLQFVQRRLFLLPRHNRSILCRLAPGVEETDSGYLFLLEVGRYHASDLYFCIPIRQVGFGTYFRIRHPSVIMFNKVDRVDLKITRPHKFLLATTLSPGIPNSIQRLFGSDKALHGAIYLGTPPLVHADHHFFDFIRQSPTPEAAYDHATDLVFLPQGIGLEVFACAYTFVDTISRISVHVGVILASEFAVRDSHAHLRLSIVNLGEERFRILFALLRRNPEEPMTWADVLQLLGEQGGSHCLPLLQNEQGDALLSVSANVKMEIVKIGGYSLCLPCLQLSSHSASLVQTGKSSSTRAVEE